MPAVEMLKSKAPEAQLIAIITLIHTHTHTHTPLLNYKSEIFFATDSNNVEVYKVKNRIYLFPLNILSFITTFDTDRPDSFLTHMCMCIYVCICMYIHTYD